MAQKILAFAGSLRSGSFNKKLVRIAAEGARAAGAEVTEVDLRDIPMPLFDGDIEREQGLPPNAKLFKQLLIEHKGILISSPEYNTAMTAVLKNAIDWASRAEPGEPPLVAFKGKVGGLMSASPGNYGGVRSLAMLRAILSHLGVVVIPTNLSIARANEAFDADGNLQDERQRETIRSIGAEVVTFVRKLG
ncbi:MAG: NAD(P)H-dependent oxidoreductase [Betaproteobacteria bacterium]|nr:NAD(P)H-dependent oxidoreductase [Betaproteobacteria bacterium]